MKLEHPWDPSPASDYCASPTVSRWLGSSYALLFPIFVPSSTPNDLAQEQRFLRGALILQRVLINGLKLLNKGNA